LQNSLGAIVHDRGLKAAALMKIHATPFRVWCSKGMTEL
jgi:hypothetical protein